ncbi:MAG: alpha/beta fold hydrolase [Anaerolineales bacterium]|nr:alpha/beta fold hydrolase [Anaerolineales bacterium]
MKSRLTMSVRLIFIGILLLTSIAAAPYKKTSQTPMEDLLAALGGSECFDGSAFTCVTIEVPLDHFTPADTRIINVTFAVLPASGERKGMFVTATGGPGYSGISSADPYLAGFSEDIFSAFDIVFFDQRGLLYSGDQNCPVAASVYYQQDARGKTPAQEAALKQSASAFSADCVNEVSDHSLLPYLGTKQAVEDLEIFRQLVGDEKFWLYGESYGTQFAQTYAASHSEHLAGLILDGTVDLTFDGFEYYVQQTQAFSDVLTESLSACNDDQACRKDTLGNAVRAYDTLAKLIENHPLTFRFPLPEGGFANRQFAFADLEYVASSQMYGESDRMMFTRALAAAASKLDLVPLARLLYLDLGVDPQTLDLIPDPTYSEAVFFGVECQDYGYPGHSPDDKADNFITTLDPFEFSIPRLSSLLYADMPCAYWPNAATDLTRPGYLFAEDVPTLVLGSTADPATPYNNGVSVYENLADGYLITQEFGPHVIFGRGNACPDDLVTDFLVNDVVPAERETVCEGYLVDEYVPLAPRFAVMFGSPQKALSAMETEIYYLPEFYYWDGVSPTSVGCNYGGTLSFAPNKTGTRINFTLDKCALAENFIMTGTGFNNVNTDRFVLNVSTTGRWNCKLKYDRKGENIKVTGKCGKTTINANDFDSDHLWHILPNIENFSQSDN